VTAEGKPPEEKDAQVRYRTWDAKGTAVEDKKFALPENCRKPADHVVSSAAAFEGKMFQRISIRGGSLKKQNIKWFLASYQHR